MATKFVVDGIEMEIELKNEDGIDWSGEFVGNTAHGMASDDEGRYISSFENYNWWAELVVAWVTMESAVREAEHQYGKDNVQSYLKNEGVYDCDLGDTPERVMAALEEYSRKGFLIDLIGDDHAEYSLTVEQAAKYARMREQQVSERGLRMACQSGNIPGARKMGRDWMIPLSGIKQYLDRRPRPGRTRKVYHETHEGE